jgi:lipoyl(octanoyl) transferase
MSAPVVWRWLGRRAYERALAQQEACWEARRAGGPDVCLAVEHPPTITLGKRATRAELRVPERVLAARGIPCVATERGGYATYHGPGQLVLYPIIGLAARGFTVATFVETLEAIMIEIAAAFGVHARRDPRGRGVWTARGKLGAVGIRVRESVTLHGLALNVATDLAAFDLIAPCGVAGLPVTSLRAEGATGATIAAVLPVVEGITRRLLAGPAFAAVLPSGAAARARGEVRQEAGV